MTHLHKKHHISILVLSLHLLAVGFGLFAYNSRLEASPCPSTGLTCKPLPVGEKNGDILVKFKNNKEIKNTLRDTGYTSFDTYKVNKLGWHLIKTNCESEGCENSHIQKLRENSNVDKTEPVASFTPFLTPNDTYYSDQWAPKKIQANYGWDVTTGKSTTVIAVIDTGFALTHQDLSTKIWSNADEVANNLVDDDGNGFVDDTRGWDFAHNDNSPLAGQDCLANSSKCGYAGHGTLTSSTATAASNNSKGIAGINWQAKIMPIQVLADDGNGTTDEVANGIIYAADNGANVISLSLGSESNASALEDAVNYAYSKGVTIVAAAGNSGEEGIYYPANYSNVIAVGASTESDARASFSTYGSQLDVVAPGSSIRSAYWTSSNQTSGYAYAYGTSLATPHVAALAALIKGEGPSMSPSEIRANIINNADKVSGMGSSNWTKSYGYGRINVKKSLAPKIQVTTNTALPSTVVAGENITANIIIKNVGATKIHLDSMYMRGYLTKGRNRDFPLQTFGLDLNPGESADYEQQRFFYTLETHYYYGVYTVSGVDYKVGSRRTFAVTDPRQKIQVTSLTISPDSPAVGEEATGIVSFKNNYSKPLSLTLARIRVAYGNGKIRPFPAEGPFVLAPGETKTISNTRSFTDPSNYSSRLSILIGRGNFQFSPVQPFMVIQ